MNTAFAHVTGVTAITLSVDQLHSLADEINATDLAKITDALNLLYDYACGEPSTDRATTQTLCKLQSIFEDALEWQKSYERFPDDDRDDLSDEVAS